MGAKNESSLKHSHQSPLTLSPCSSQKGWQATPLHSSIQAHPSIYTSRRRLMFTEENLNQQITWFSHQTVDGKQACSTFFKMWVRGWWNVEQGQRMGEGVRVGIHINENTQQNTTFHSFSFLLFSPLPSPSCLTIQGLHIVSEICVLLHLSLCSEIELSTCCMHAIG